MRLLERWYGLGYYERFWLFAMTALLIGGIAILISAAG
jgi:hypothetical protein